MGTEVHDSSKKLIPLGSDGAGMASESPAHPGCHFMAAWESLALICTCSQVNQLGVWWPEAGSKEN